MKRALVIAALAGCSVEPLDLTGKHCPCAEGWICDTARDVCQRDPATVDAAAIDAPAGDGPPAIDAPPGSSCLGGAPGGSLYSDDFADLIGWVTDAGTWSAPAGEALQADSGAAASYAYPAGTGGFTDYRLSVRARRTGGTTGAMGLALRVDTASKAQYDCVWHPASGAFELTWVRTNGTVGGTLAQMTIDVGSLPGYDPAASFTVEALVQGSQLRCCVRDLAGASATVTDTRYAAGAPGLRTGSLAVAFDDFRVDTP